MAKDGIGALKPDTVISLFRETAINYSNIIAMCEKVDGQKLYTGYTYKQYWDMCWQAARAMRKVSIKCI